MNNKVKIYIDGVATRKAIGEMAGRKDGIDSVCKAAGLPSEPINKACLNGYAYANVITKYMKAGIPIVISGEPIPSRVKVRHARKSPEKKPEESFEILPIQLSIDNIKEITATDLLKDIMIKKFGEIIEELKKI